MTLIFVLSGGIIQKTIEVNISRYDLTSMIQSYHKTLSDIGRKREYIPFSKSCMILGNKLYNLLLRDVMKDINESKKVLIVPDEILCMLPFEALVESYPINNLELLDKGYGKFAINVCYVGDKRIFNYWQSASSMTTLRDNQKNIKGDNLLVIADPVFSEDDVRINEKDYDYNNYDFENILLIRELYNSIFDYVGWDRFSRLESTSDFSKSLSTLYGKKTTTLLGLEANESNLKNKQLNYYGQGVIFATHGILDDKLPFFQQSSLILSNPKFTGELLKEDGFLTMNEIMNLKIPTEIVATFACMTGLGELVRGEGVMNMGRAFQYAGARSVLVSLWKVEDESTNKLGERFFTGLKRGEEKDIALMEARRLLRQEGYEHPFYWAGFILIGERNILSIYNKSFFQEYWFLILSVISLLLIVRFIIWQFKNRFTSRR